jgi:hypothetical protein
VRTSHRKSIDDHNADEQTGEPTEQGQNCRGNDRYSSPAALFDRFDEER